MSALPTLLMALCLSVSSAVTSNHWVRGQRCPSDRRITLHVSLALSPAARQSLEQTFWEVSDPASRKYGKYLTRDQVTELLAVPDENVRAVTSFFDSVELASVSVSPHKDSVRVDMGCREAEALFHVQLYEYVHAVTGALSTRSAARSTLPSMLAPLVELVGGLDDHPLQRMRSTTYGSGQERRRRDGRYKSGWNDCDSNCEGQLVPSVLRSQYGIPPPSDAPSNVTWSGMAVAEFESNWCQDGLDAFKAACGLTTSLTVDHQIGGNGPGICKSRHGGYTCAEAMLDITYIKALASGIKLTDVSERSAFSIQAWATQLAQMKDGELPLVHSISFGEDEVEQSSTAYMQACNREFMKLGLRGVSLLFASGDQGVWGRTGGGTPGDEFRPDFPASSPFVTAVGGTTLAREGTIGAERSWQNSGGGFSNVFARPAYQDAAVEAFLASASNLPDQRHWNRTGRAYPDVSALAGGDNAYCVSVDGKSFNGFTGTSASTPVWAAVVALLNQRRLERGGSPLGFLNPALYANAGAFHDIVHGMNGAGTGIGFNATKGYDPCTGLGTIDFARLAAALG